MKRQPRATQLARELLTELLAAFSAVEGSKGTARAARARVPNDRDDYLSAYQAELADAHLVLNDCVEHARALRQCGGADQLLTPDDYRAAWGYIVEKWNDAIDACGWQTLPRLCEGCGRGLLLRAGKACGPRCKKLLEKRRARAREAEREK